MNFKSLKINGFGKIRSKELYLKPGINIIYGENEAGKSTLLNFLIAMLYGASKNKNGKNISNFDKYKPWKTEEFSGSMQYELDNGENFEVYREFRKKNPSIYNSEKNDISKKFVENKTKGIQFIEEQTGIDEEMYLNTAVIEQEDVKLTQNSQNAIIQRISNKVSSGDENISYKKAITKLTKMQGEKIGTERTQNKPMNTINIEIQNLEKARQELEEIKESMVDSNKELEIFKKKIAEYEKDKTQKINKLTEDINLTNDNKSEEKKLNLKLVLFIVLMIISILMLIFITNKFIGLSLLVVSIVCFILFTIRDKKEKAENKEQEEKAKKDFIKTITNEVKLNEENIEKMKRNLYEAEFCQKEDYKRLEELPKIVEKLENLYEEQENLRKLNNSYNIARQCLEIAYEEAKKNISPKFNETLCDIVAKISNNKYYNVKTNDENGLVVQIENGNYMPVDRLSIGTIDQMYLAFRLSSLKELSKENMPIILDEAFAYFDDERLKNILEYISEEYKNNQILIFSCSKREKEALEELNIDYNFINI